MKFVASVIVFGMGFLIASGLHAEIYSWTDENGVKHYSHMPPTDRSLQINTAPEIPDNPGDTRQPEITYEKNVETVLEQLDEENEPPGAADSQRPPELSRQQRIQNEKKRLEENLAYLESLPPDAFANSRSRGVIIGKYRYRLQQLMLDPDNYFYHYGF